MHKFKAIGVGEKLRSVGTSAAGELSASSSGHCTSRALEPVFFGQQYITLKTRVLKNTISEYSGFCCHPQLKCKSWNITPKCLTLTPPAVIVQPFYIRTQRVSLFEIYVYFFNTGIRLCPQS